MCPPPCAGGTALDVPFGAARLVAVTEAPETAGDAAEDLSSAFDVSGVLRTPGADDPIV